VSDKEYELYGVLYAICGVWWFLYFGGILNIILGSPSSHLNYVLPFWYFFPSIIVYWLTMLCSLLLVIYGIKLWSTGNFRFFRISRVLFIILMCWYVFAMIYTAIAYSLETAY
jgi:hypothetical protein